MTDYEKAVEAMKRLMKPDYSKYEKATQAMNWLRENTCNHYVVDETAYYTKDNGGMFLHSVKISGVELIEVAKKLGWKDE
jgi:hypothetical protein